MNGLSAVSRPSPTYPLREWTRRLTHAEHDADVLSDREPFEFSDQRDVDPDDGEHWDHLFGWSPVLPPEVAQYPLWRLVRSLRCDALVSRYYGQPVDSPELLTNVDKCDPPHIWAYKNETTKIVGVWISLHNRLKHMACTINASQYQCATRY